MVKYIKENGNMTCLFSGRMDTNASSSLEKEIMENIAGAENVVFDFKELEYVSSLFLRICLMAAKKMGDKPFKIVQVSPSVKKVFVIAGFDKIINFE